MAATLALTLAACSAPETETPTPAEPGQASERPSPEETSAEDPAVVVDLDQPSPLEATWDRIRGTTGLTKEAEAAESRARMLAAEEATAACMAAEGFEYVPWLPEGPISGASLATQPQYADLDPLERARQIGYGFVMEREEALLNPVEVGTNPNFAIRDSLSEEGRREYGEAGGRCSVGDMSAEEASRFEDPVYLEFHEDANEVETAIWQDRRVVALDRAWSDCVADAGFAGFEQPYVTLNEVSERWEEWRRTYEETPSAGAAELQELIDWEVSLAVADETCQAELDYVATHRAVRDELESAFLADREDDITYLTELFGK
ncbi:hypothetical protein [Salana multivorans]